MEEQQETKWICGFWRRIGALVVVGSILGQVFGELFVDLDSWGRFVKGFDEKLELFVLPCITDPF